jgi:hypothetical protein
MIAHSPERRRQRSFGDPASSCCELDDDDLWGEQRSAVLQGAEVDGAGKGGGAAALSAPRRHLRTTATSGCFGQGITRTEARRQRCQGWLLAHTRGERGHHPAWPIRVGCMVA